MLYLLVRRIWGNILTVGGLEEVDEIPWCHVRACVLCVCVVVGVRVFVRVCDFPFLLTSICSTRVKLGMKVLPL